MISHKDKIQSKPAPNGEEKNVIFFGEQSAERNKK
jgi:hypothetical protein